MIQTERLNIREASADDIPSVMELEIHPDNRDYLWQGTHDEHISEISDPNHLLLVFDKRSDATRVGFALIRMDFKSRWFEIRRIAVSEKHRGYGTEAMYALFGHAFTALNMNKVWLDVYPHNTVGIRLYEKLGMHRDGVLRENYHSATHGFLDQIIYSLLRREYEPARQG